MAARYQTLPWERLSATQLRCLRLHCQGLHIKDVAREVGLAWRTVQKYLADAYILLGIHEPGRGPAYLACYRLGMCDAPEGYNPPVPAFRAKDV